ncbi:hypothetical protein BDZ94DRAFT_1273075 [Collybia nuda]|uniref:F-box domain-containing protein n=1 Tax=Collybia nuda TaxID=64659 RepID=A0A9P5XVA7_9AGAR|nr:hypothetical protein BDZ94DRAFT_1273075 [Collybia nuda]
MQSETDIDKETTSSLPDELVLEILSHALWLPDDQFESQSDFPLIRSARCLAVCKSWFRIGIPLLYHSVVLRSSLQAEALALSLRENKSRGRLIERLRIEGGYGGATYNIVKAASKVKVLCLTLYISASDNVSGLRRALPMLRPTRVVLYDQIRRGLDNQQTITLHETLNSCITKWKTMKQLYFPYSEAMGLHSTSTPVDALSQAIKDAPSLRELEMPFGYSFPKHLMTMAENPHLRVIRVYRKHTHAGVTFNFEHAVESVSRLKELVVFVDDPL